MAEAEPEIVPVLYLVQRWWFAGPGASTGAPYILTYELYHFILKGMVDT